jgi:hypothetical protein
VNRTTLSHIPISVWPFPAPNSTAADYAQFLSFGWGMRVRGADREKLPALQGHPRLRRTRIAPRIIYASHVDFPLFEYARCPALFYGTAAEMNSDLGKFRTQHFLRRSPNLLARYTRYFNVLNSFYRLRNPAGIQPATRVRGVSASISDQSDP